MPRIAPSIDHLPALTVSSKGSRRARFVGDTLLREYRAHRRHPVDVPILYTRELAIEHQRPSAGRLADLSRGGCRLETEEALEVGETLSLQVADCSLPPDPFIAGFRARDSVMGRVVRLPSPAWRAPRLALAGFENPTAGLAADRAAGRDLRSYGVEFLEALELSEGRAIDRAIPLLGALLFAAGVANVLYLKWFNLYFFWYQPLLNSYSLLVGAYILSRFLAACFYRPPRVEGYFPDVTAVVACKNEADSIGRVLDSIFGSDYPRERLEVIAVDDGSTDRTFQEMQLARERHPRLQVVRFDQNRGKRHGMAEGARRAKGEILVFVDSDSFLRRDAIRKIVRGFHDREVGAVCGHAQVENAERNLLTRMQEVRYYVAFRVLKAAESIFGTVSCCSGCLAAYRRTSVMEALEAWLGQRFLGAEATFGDDRSLTNHMLRRHRVIYDREAVCSTIVPEKYGSFFRQQLRWKKSWIRESLIACAFLWRRHPLAACCFYAGVILPFSSPLVVFKALVLPAAGLAQFSWLYLYGASVMALLYGLLYLIRFRSRTWLAGFLFSFFYLGVLVWQTYWALLTLRKNHWGTR